ncbi:HEPN domain-containing protein [Algoriphagus zhangzhouensis]|uniref:Sulfite reductase (Ferredoxin) n=1 Tax=Algoriphagus zhangzhouensis TaxID=1073327 RepID=A0A1M7Z9Y6_9BACT|nr:HEPN domain-containing protein [Algoriphagus zhangzhouensis]TDY47352.1 sulfite reductase (ferredoxin) [Algoriphagus zhangzhouensis]SHO61612.1 sulfite reductase (ferredoxin) [Algoriphagus zhangzhouensis]
MQSFRTEIENPIVERDILELERKIALFKEGKIDEEKFRSLRLARGVYGQRQPGVQMIRIKLPYGRVTGDQLRRICKVSEEYSTGRLHITTRQDIQIHYVSLDRTPELWAELEKDDVTLREACGNTVRNVTASETAGIDPNEPFDVTPYADATFKYFLRNPICQEMGRKFKMSFSSSDEDTGLAYMHDLGFIPKVKTIDGKEVRGFKVLLGGGLGSQPRHGDVIAEFLETDQLIPLIEVVLRIFDRHGERARRNKARMKFLVKDLGLEAFLELVEQERKALPFHSYPLDFENSEAGQKLPNPEKPELGAELGLDFELWKQTNVLPQKQAGYVAVGVRVPLGDFYISQARALADLVQKYANDEVRFTLRQNFLIRDVREDLVPYFYQELKKIGLAERGYNSLGDITACPGTDTCNLGIASSTGIAVELEKVILDEYPQYLKNKDLVIKISGCMNACGQHNMAHIGFQGMSMRVGKTVIPALQVLLGGGNLGDGNGRFADKVTKIPSRRGPEALRILLNDFEANSGDLDFLSYYDEKGQIYFYELIKELADSSKVTEADRIDWGREENYEVAVGVGECAGVVIDLVATLLLEAKEKLDLGQESLENGRWSDSIYHHYAGLINAAKALLLGEDVSTNSYANIISLFDEKFVETGKVNLGRSFADKVYEIKNHEPSEEFAKAYAAQALEIYQVLKNYREEEVEA